MNPFFSEEFKRNLYSFFIIRFFFLFALFFSFFIIPFINETVKLFSIQNKILLVLVLAFATFNIISLFLNRTFPEKYLYLFAYVQFFFEIVFWVSVSYLTGGIKSPYLYVLIINIIYSGILLHEKGAFFTTFLAFFFLLLQVLMIKFQMLPLLSPELVELYTYEWKTFFARLFVYLLFFSFTGMLASRIAKGFEQVNKNLLRSDQLNRELKKHFFSIFSNIEMGIVITKEESVVYANKYADQFESKLKRLVFELIDHIEVYKTWQELKVEKRIYNYTVMPYMDDQKVVIFSDVTEMKSKEEEILRKEKMAAIGNLTASIAHEIKNPLTSLIGATDLMFGSFQAADQVDDDSLQLISIIRREGNRVKKLLDNLFNYTEERGIKKAPTDLHSLIDEITTIFNASYPQIQINSHLDHITLPVDHDRLKEVFWNLLINSIEAMQGKGRIEIFGKRDIYDYLIFIQDEGGGISEDYLEKIFDPFFSTKKRGTGLGLALVYKVIKMHGGEVRVRNIGSGSEFCIIIPLLEEDSE